MSFIGPRPLFDYYFPYYTDREKPRMEVRGGLVPPEVLSGNITPSWDEQLEAEAAAFDAEIKRMTERKKSVERQIERMKAAQVDFMQATGQRKASAGTFTLTLRENKSVKVLDESAIPDTFWKPQPAKLDKAGIKDALKAGESVPGCEIETSFSVSAR